jgi:hypothetical protein
VMIACNKPCNGLRGFARAAGVSGTDGAKASGNRWGRGKLAGRVARMGDGTYGTDEMDAGALRSVPHSAWR